MIQRFYLPLLILLVLSLSSCQNSNLSQLEATNQALSEQVNTLMTQLTQQAISPIKPTDGPVSTSGVVATEIPSTSASPVPQQEAGAVAPTLIVSGSGAITPWSNQKAYPSVLFGAANVHMICDPNDAAKGEIWIDNKNTIVGCGPGSESWSPWKTDITVGDHYIYSLNDNDKYEFWTMGTTPFTIRNKYGRSDYMFRLNNAGIYNLSTKLIKGQFTLYLTCEAAQNFTYEITASTTIPVVLKPARCEILIRDSPPGTLYPGEIEVSLEFLK